MTVRALAYVRQHHLGLIALFVALGGTSYAAATGSIDSREIKNSSIRGTDIRNSTITSKDVKNDSLLAADFKAGQLPQGPAGATNIVTRSKTRVIQAAAPAEPFFTFAECAAGERATGGGVRWLGGPVGADHIDMSYPGKAFGAPTADGETPTTFAAQGTTNGGIALTRAVIVYVVCVKP